MLSGWQFSTNPGSTKQHKVNTPVSGQSVSQSWLTSGQIFTKKIIKTHSHISPGILLRLFDNVIIVVIHYKAFMMILSHETVVTLSLSLPSILR